MVSAQVCAVNRKAFSTVACRKRFPSFGALKTAGWRWVWAVTAANSSSLAGWAAVC